MHFLLLAALTGCAAKTDVRPAPRRMASQPKQGAPAQTFARPKGRDKCHKDIKQIGHLQGSQIQRCYDYRLVKNPGMRGRIVLALKVDGFGRVAQAKVTTNSTNDSHLEACVRASALTWGFPKSCAGWVSFPFKLEPSRQLPAKKSNIPMPQFNH